MATTCIMPLHTGKGRTVGKVISNISASARGKVNFINYLPKNKGIY